MTLRVTQISQALAGRKRLFLAALILTPAFGVAGILWSTAVRAQDATSFTAAPPSRFRIGEKLSYNISFGKFTNAGYAETHVIARGKLGGKDAVEIRAKIKTFELVSAAFFMLDESRTVFLAPETGLPLYIGSYSNDSVIPKETFSNYLTQPTQNFDLVSLIYKAREAGGVGTFPLFEGEQQFTATLLPVGVVTARTDAGNFETTVSRLQSDFLTANGVNDLHIHFTTDEARVPVVIRFTTAKGEFKAILAAIVLPEPETPTPTPTPGPIPTPKLPATPTPTPTPAIENLPLATELGFQLGELLSYQVTAGGKSIGIISLNARERKLIQKEDTLVLTASVTGVEPGSNLLRLGDSATAEVNAETLAPKSISGRFASTFAGLSQSVSFDRRTGIVTFDVTKTADEPVGTHSILSLIYAMRSFNLKPSKNATNPVNDTRVAVFWETKAYVFTLRPSDPGEITINGEKVSAQLISVNTGNPQLDALAIKVWLGTETRVPLRFTFGAFQADLISQTSNLSK